ncbi:MAG: hypothetical protein CSB33_04385 [Desulfobacterales bacterium]|nr:MAG: hypothetical protein CSB33_04385 [Desulfobacterales bacterium]
MASGSFNAFLYALLQAIPEYLKRAGKTTGAFMFTKDHQRPELIRQKIAARHLHSSASGAILGRYGPAP